MALSWLRTGIALLICFATFCLMMSVTPRRVYDETNPFSKQSCPFYPQSGLVACTLPENDGCNFCKEVDRFCQTVSPEEAVYIQDPFGTGLKYRVPDGRWCLPPRPAVEEDCNLYTSVPLLTQTMDGQLKWGCLCTKPNLVVNEGGYGDCTQVVACDPQIGGSLVHKDTGRLWSDDKNWDPRVFGVCNCPPGYKYIPKADGEKRCLPDSCFPGVTLGTEGRCTCPVKTFDGKAYTSYVEYDNTCILDPCNPDGYTENGTCVCQKGTTPVMDPGVVGKWKCTPLCGPINNPCGGRGECYIKEDGTVGCWKCKSPYIQTQACACGKLPCEDKCQCSTGNECANACCKPFLSSTFKCIPFPDMCIGESKPKQDLDATFKCGP